MNAEIQRLFEAAAELPEDRRQAFLDGQTADPEIRREVDSLLAHDALAEPFFADAIQSEASSLASHTGLSPGALVGAYRVISLLAHGGMGSVYLAERADISFEQRVAIKVIHHPSPSAFLLDRFHQERRILAKLGHPNIASLFDGGQTPDGSPYFVMEYVSGQSIDVFCEAGSLSLTARLELFMNVCDAVQHAHQHLIVHRDLKPANILITSDGRPKLLDFGIAKVLDPARTEVDQVSTRLLTPEYASPEQIRGDPITTTTDVYALGGVLYRLITGHPPHETAMLSPLDGARAIAEQEVPRASSLRPGLSDDIDAILQKALRNDSTRRYRSADEFANDIRRFLEGRPVFAAPDSLAYRSRKFVKRNWIAVTATVAVALALTGAAGVALWQAHRAERRFAEVRQLANTFVFEFENSIHNLSGATKARELVVRTAQDYLGRLARDAGGDRDLARELATSYKKLGDVQGNVTGANVGDLQAALTSYRKSLALRDSIGEANSSGPKERVAYLDTLAALASLERQAGDLQDSQRVTARGVTLAASWMKSGASDPEFLIAAAQVYKLSGYHQLDRAENIAALATLRQTLALRQSALRIQPNNLEYKRMVATGYWGVAAAESAGGNIPAAVKDFREAVRLLREVSAADPRNSSFRRDLFVTTNFLANTTGKLRRMQKSKDLDEFPIFREALRIGHQMISEDIDNAQIESNVAVLDVTYGMALWLAGKSAEAMQPLLDGVEIDNRLLKKTPGDRETTFTLARLHRWIGECRNSLHDPVGALHHHQVAKTLFDQIGGSSGPMRYRYDQACNIAEIGDVLAAQGDLTGARAAYRSALETAATLPAGQSTSLIAEIRALDLRALNKMHIRSH